MNLYKVKEHPELLKDMESKAVLNTNYAALLEYRNKQKMSQEIELLKSEVCDIKDKLNLIVDLLNR